MDQLAASDKRVPMLSKRRAMVIDDSRAMRSILRRALEECGFEVVEAVHGRDAIERLALMRIPELVLVDWNMPEMTGIEFVIAIRQDHNYDAMPIVMVTTETETEQIERALTAGVNQYVMKPFTKEILVDKLSALGLGDALP
jgi:two-component system, chemotaxis family, chemotaxis protein CheY